MADRPGEKAEDVGCCGRGTFRAADAPVAPTWSQIHNPYVHRILLEWAQI